MHDDPGPVPPTFTHTHTLDDGNRQRNTAAEIGEQKQPNLTGMGRGWRGKPTDPESEDYDRAPSELDAKMILCL